MKKETRIKLADLSIAVMTATIIFIILWFIGYIFSIPFDLAVFGEKTSSFLLIFILAAFSIVVCSAFLNISLNISLIAESKIQEMVAGEKPKFNRNGYYIFSAIVVLLIVFLFLADMLSRQSEEDRLVEESMDLVTRYERSVNDISEALIDTSKLRKIPDILKFFSSQKDDFPNIQVITSSLFEGQQVFLTIKSYDEGKNLTEPFFSHSFYKCNAEDADYLSGFFNNKMSDIYFWSKEDNYYLYYPITRGKYKFILLFSSVNRYGKFGS